MIFILAAVTLLSLLISSSNALTLKSSRSRMRIRANNPLFAEVEPSSPPVKTPFDEARKKATPGKSWIKARAIGVGACPGQNNLPNSHYETLVDTSDAWITKRTGIRNRHLVQPGSTLRDLAVQSALEALKSSGTDPKDIDLVIVATSSPDDLFGDAPSVAMAVGASKAAAFDITAACSGFVYGMITASQFLQTGAYKKILVIGADALTRFIDWKDRGTCILFGDGAGAIVMESAGSESDSGILGFALHSNGEGNCNLNLKFNSNFAPLSNKEQTMVDQGSYGKMFMNGAEVYKFAVNTVPEVINEALNNAGLTASDIDWLLLHQANIRIMEHASEVIGIPMSKVIRNVEEYGNTSAGSIPLALAEAVRSGKIKKGDVIAVAGFGAGLSWASVIMRWG